VRLPPSAKKALLCGVLVLAAALAQAAERSGAPSTSEGAGSVGVVRQAGFRIHGHVEGLYPGAMKWLHLRFRNPNPFPITVTRVRTTVHADDHVVFGGKSVDDLTLAFVAELQSDDRRDRVRGRV